MTELSKKQLKAKVHVFTLSQKSLEVDYRRAKNLEQKDILLGAIDSVSRQKEIAEERLKSYAAV